jgi:hypothetical protein
MMKRLFLALMILLTSSVNLFAGDCPLLSVDDTISVPIIPVDTLGRRGEIDSLYVLVRYTGDAANTYCYTAAYTSSGASSDVVDSTQFHSVTGYYFFDVVDDIDGGKPNGLYVGEIIVFDQGEPWSIPFSFMKVFDEGRDIYACLDKNISDIDDDQWDNPSRSLTAGVTVTTNNDKTGYSLTSDYLTKADSGGTGASYLRAKYIGDKTGYSLSSSGLNGVTQSSGSVITGTNNDKTGYSLNSDYLTKADSGAAGASYLRAKYVGDKTGYSLFSSQSFSTSGSVGSVTGSVGSISGVTFPQYFGDLFITETTGRVAVGTSYDKSGYALSASGLDGVTQSSGSVRVGTNLDKTGYSLTQSFPSNFESMLISAGGYVSPNFGDVNGTLSHTDFASTFFDNIWTQPDSNTIKGHQIPEWMIDNLAGGGESSWTEARIDSVLDLVRHNNHVVVADTNNFGEVLMLMPESWGPDSAAIALVFQGEASGLTVSDIVEGFSGLGNHLCSLYVFNAADTSAVSKCDVKIRNVEGNATEALWYTGSSGLVTLSLMNGTYHVTLFDPGYTFPGMPYVLNVDGSSVNDTIWASEFDPGEPPSPQLCNVYGNFSRLIGEATDNVMVKVTCDTRVLREPNGRIVIGYEEEAVPDSTGQWVIPLYPNSILDPDDSRYTFIFIIGRKEYKRENVVVPDQSQWEFEW